MFHQILITTIIVLSTSIAHADWMQGLFDKEPLAGPCRKKVELPRLDPASLYKEANRLKENRKYCEAAEYFKVLMGEATTPEEYSRMWHQRIESFFFQYDYEKFFDSALDFLELRRGSHLSERVHFMVLKAVNELIHEKKDLGNPWLQFALGVHPEQLAKDSIKNKMKFRSFLEDHPQSEFGGQVQGFLKNSKIAFNSEYLNQTRMLVLRREYVPAIVRYQFLLNIGPEFEERGVATFELIQVLREFSYTVENERIISTQKLARWLTTSEVEVSQGRRQELARSLHTQSERLLQLMVDKLPNDTWTRRAVEFFGN